MQDDLTHRNNSMSDLNSRLASCVIKIFSGSAPASCAVADTGTLGATLNGSATFGTVSNGVLTANAITNTTPANNVAITPGYFRAYPSTPTTTNAIIQGTVFQNVSLATNAVTAANSAVLSFASTTGVSVGMTVAGTGIPTNATVVAVTATNVTMSMVSTAGVASAASITFGGDLSVGSLSFGPNIAVNVNSFVRTAAGA